MAKGICFALGIPLIPVPTHLVMAQLGLLWVANGAYIIPLQDARRQEVYHTIYQLQGHSIIEVSPCTNHILSEASYAEYLQQQTPVYFVGDGASKWQELWLATNEQSALVYFLPNIKPLAEQVGQLAGVMLLAGYTAPNIVSYTPNYLKPWVGNQTVPKTPIRQFKAD
jgi:tRNA threonylcarbamoyladenosine biosynthesis protein TsaB